LAEPARWLRGAWRRRHIARRRCKRPRRRRSAEERDEPLPFQVIELHRNHSAPHSQHIELAAIGQRCVGYFTALAARQKAEIEKWRRIVEADGMKPEAN